MLDFWKDLFKPWILDRGYEYYLADCVDNLRISKDSILADVIGSDTYSVEISLFQGLPAAMECTCPHAESGNNCKHMAAVLFAADLDHFLPQNAQEETSHLDVLPWETAVNNLSDTALRALIRELATDNVSLQNRLIRLSTESPTDAGPLGWKTDLMKMVWDVADDDDYISYDDAYDLMMDMIDYMDRRLTPLLSQGSVMDAYDLVSTVFTVAAELEMDDSDGGLYSLIESCKDAWRTIFDLASSEERLRIHQCVWLEKDLWPSDFALDELLDFFLSIDWGETFNKQHLNWLDQKISHLSSNDYHMRNYLTLRETIMRNLGASEDDVIRFWKPYATLSFARDRLLDLYMQSDPQAAISLLRECKIKDQNSHYTLLSHSKKLIQLYCEEQMEADCKEELLYLILHLRYISAPYLQLLVDHCDPNEWSQLLHRLLSSSNTSHDRCTLLDFNKDYTQLAAELKINGRLSLFDTYEHNLRQWSEYAARECLVHILKKEMEAASCRKNYWTVIQHLRRVCTYPDGYTTAKNLAQYWRTYHNNRPAMKDELKKAGF